MSLRVESFISGQIWACHVKDKEKLAPTVMLANFIQSRLFNATKVSIIHLDRKFGSYSSYPWEEITAVICFEDPEKFIEPPTEATESI